MKLCVLTIECCWTESLFHLFCFVLLRSYIPSDGHWWNFFFSMLSPSSMELGRTISTCCLKSLTSGNFSKRTTLSSCVLWHLKAKVFIAATLKGGENYNEACFQAILSSTIFIVFVASEVVSQKKKENLREKFKICVFSLLHTTCQSLCFSVLKS